MKGKELYVKGHAERIVKNGGTGKLYRPANGTEGMMFMARYCELCGKWEEGDCRIQFHSMLYDERDEEYPKEWQYDTDGQPTCTAFKAEE